jgi:hypothetical protein
VANSAVANSAVANSAVANSAVAKRPVCTPDASRRAPHAVCRLGRWMNWCGRSCVPSYPTR